MWILLVVFPLCTFAVILESQEECQAAGQINIGHWTRTGQQVLAEAAPSTTLRHVRKNAKVFIDGVEYPLEPRQQSILVALIDVLDHEMDKDALKSACGSQAQRFSPSKEFDRNTLVYRTFIRYQRDDARYALIIPDEDRDWLH